MMRRWETYLALLAVIIGSLASFAESPRVRVGMVVAAVAIILLVFVTRLRAMRPPAPTERKLDAYERIERIRDQRRR